MLLFQLGGEVMSAYQYATMTEYNFGAIWFNPRQRTTTITVVTYNPETKSFQDVAWRRWDNVSSKQLCHDLNFCGLRKRCHSIIYNRYQIDGKFQKRLSKIPKIYPIAISHECWADIFGKLNILNNNNKMILFPDGRAIRQIDGVYTHPNNGKQILYYYNNLYTDFAMAYILASYNLTMFYDFDKVA